MSAESRPMHSTTSPGANDALGLILQALRSHGKKPKRRCVNDGWAYTALCPGHSDHDPSLHIGSNPDGSAKLKCFAGCESKDVLAAVGLSARDLFRPKARSGGDISKYYVYRNAKGDVKYRVVRKDPKGFFQQRLSTDGVWLNNMQGVRRLLYRLPELVAAPADQWVFVVEGEKDTDKLATIGLVATTNAGGAGKWPTNDKALHGRRVCLVPDLDEAGLKHMNMVGARLDGHCTDLRLLELPGEDLPTGYDVWDWLTDGGDRDKLLALADEAPRFEAPAESEPSQDPLALYIPAGKVRTGKVLHYAAAKFLAETGAFTGVETEGKQPELYAYADGIWVSPGERRLGRELEPLLGADNTEHAVRQVRHHLHAKLCRARDDMGLPAGKVAVKNGLLDIRTRELRPLRPDDWALWRLPMTYDPKATCPEIEKFLGEGLPDETHRLTVYEFLGYALQPSNMRKKALIFFGPRDTGKSVLLYIAHSMFGESNDANQGIQALGTRPWATAKLYGCPVNICADLNPEVIQGVGRLKELIAGDVVSGERKFVDPFSFLCTTKFIFSANEAPSRSTDDDAFWSRWITMVLPEVVAPDDRDPDLRLKLTKPAELSGLLNLALTGLARLTTNRRFSHEPSTTETKMAWESYGKSIQRFLVAFIELDPEAPGSPQDEVYGKYVDFARKNAMAVEGKSKFTRELRKFGGSIASRRRRIKGELIYVYAGCRLRNRQSD